MAEGAGKLNFKPLIGTDEATVDEKGRLLVSKKKRERLGDAFVLSYGAVGCLVAYPAAVWEQKLAEIFAADSNNAGREQYSRLILGMADDELKFDTQGRVVIPLKLRDMARIKDKVVLIGCGDRLEIWALPEWEMFNRMPDAYGKERRDAVAQAYAQMKDRAAS